MAVDATAHTSSHHHQNNNNVLRPYGAIASDGGADDLTHTQYDQSLHTATLELKYERSAHLVDMVAKDEAMRKLRFDIHVLEDDNEELRDLLAQEEDRAESLERLVDEHLARAEVAESHVQVLEDEVRAMEQDLSASRAEIKALHNLSTDSEKLLTEKLEMTRELHNLKPELEHLRTQVALNDTLLVDKLSLQRQLSEVQVQLEHAKSEAKRAFAKRRNTQHEFAQEETIDDLRKALTREKRLRQKAQEELQSAQTELDAAKDTAQRTQATEVKQAEVEAAASVHTEELRRALAQEKKEHDREAKSWKKAQGDWDATKALLDDKLNQFRTKLKATKEKLKETEAHLAAAEKQRQTAPAPAAGEPEKKTKKRKADRMDPDATTLGTPGDSKPAKRGRKAVTAAAAAAAATSALGDKSTFSITPFLNRTMSVINADANDSDREADKQDGSSDSEADANASPSTAAAKEPSGRKPPLAQQPASKHNAKKAGARKPKTAALEKVVEEDEDTPSQQQASKTAAAAAAAAAATNPNTSTTTTTTTTKIPLRTNDSDAENTTTAAPTQDPPAKKQKLRKSLAAFPSFALAPEPSVTLAAPAATKAKKRKLGGLGKTLFDDDDDHDAVAAKPLPGRTAMFSATAAGPLGVLRAGSGLGARNGGAGVVKKGNKGLFEADGFVFSPLKRNRGAGGGASFLK